MSIVSRMAGEGIMQFLTVRNLRMSAASVLRKLPREGEVILTRHGHPVAIITPTNENDLEDTLRSLRRTRAIQAVDRMQRAAAQRGLARMSARQISQQVAAARRELKR